MGLKIKNYYCEERKETLAEAYAVVRSFSVGENGLGSAIIGIEKTRERAIDKDIKPMVEVPINFVSPRDGKDREAIYKTATTPYKVTDYNFETHKHEEKEVKPFFYGWDNDIVSGE